MKMNNSDLVLSMKWEANGISKKTLTTFASKISWKGYYVREN